MSPERKDELVAALRKHKFLKGQSDFLKQAADALVQQSKNGKSPIAQPLCFLTVEQRTNLDRYEAMCEVIQQPKLKSPRRRSG